MRRAMVIGIAIMGAGCAGTCRQDATSSGVAEPTTPSGVPALAARLEELRRGGRRDIPYRPPEPAEERAYSDWVLAVARAATAGEDPSAALPPPGFVLERIHDMWLLAEVHEQRRGAGAVVLRPGAASPVLVEAPHTFFDVGTLPIALAAFDAGRCRALLINTVHRYASRRGDVDTGSDDDDGGVVSDVAHAPSSFFLAAHRVLLGSAPPLRTVQLHGFADDKAPGADLILSASGTGGPVDAVATRLREVLGEGVRRYPQDVRILGGTKNVQAAASREAAAPFLHVEMSRSLRDRLVNDADLRRRVGAALVSPAP
jgi:hypothetical protein